MAKIGLIWGADFHGPYLNPLLAELTSRGHDCEIYKVDPDGLKLTYELDCDLYISPDSHYLQWLPCDRPLVQTYHGLFAGGGYFSHKGNRKAAALLSSGPALTEYLKDAFPHKYIIPCGDLKLDGTHRKRVPHRTCVYGTNWNGKFCTYPTMISSLHSLQDDGWTVKVTLHQWLIHNLTKGWPEGQGINLVQYAEKWFDFLGGSITPQDIAHARFLLCGFSSLPVEAFVLGTPVILIRKHNEDTREWPMYERMLQICPVVREGNEFDLRDAVKGLKLQIGPEHEELRRQIAYPLDGHAAERAASGIEQVLVEWGAKK